MSSHLVPTDVFVTDGYPQHTYVDQAGGKPERDLKDALEQENKIVSIVGSSKTGKTTLCDKFFGTEKGADKILVTGDSVPSIDALWHQAYGQIADDTMPNYHDLTYAQVIDVLIKMQIPLVIDDFHYIAPDVQTALCRQMKNAASQRLRFVVLNTPHRGDDPIRNNNDLSGRFFSIDMGYWEVSDLAQIGTKGFSKLGLTVSDDVISILAKEALRSPQLMQTLCLETCRSLSQDIPFENQKIDSGNFDLVVVKERAVRSNNLSTQLHYLRSGPPERGSKRIDYPLCDGKVGDLYEVLVRIIALDPPFIQMSLDSIKVRVAQIAAPTEPNIRAALNQIRNLFKDGHPPIEWDDDKRLFSIVDPHFYFYLRCQYPQSAVPQAER